MAMLNNQRVDMFGWPGPKSQYGDASGALPKSGWMDRSWRYFAYGS